MESSRETTRIVVLNTLQFPYSDLSIEDISTTKIIDFSEFDVTPIMKEKIIEARQDCLIKNIEPKICLLNFSFFLNGQKDIYGKENEEKQRILFNYLNRKLFNIFGMNVYLVYLPYAQCVTIIGE